MSGFFSMEDFVTNSTDHLCSNCGLYKGKQRSSLVGEGKSNILIIGKSPGFGEVTSFFEEHLKSLGMNLINDAWRINAIRCSPGEREPSRQEISCCFPYIEKTISDLKPKFIWLMGEAAITSFYMNSFSELSPARWRGLCIPDHEKNAWVIPMFDPSHAFENQEDPLIMSQFTRDLKFAVDCIKNKGEVKDEFKPNFDDVIILKDFNSIYTALYEEIDNPSKYLIFDYETTGLKPYRKNHRIVSCSYSTEKIKGAVSFPMQHPHFEATQQKQIATLWSKVLLNKSKKIAHNIQFEDVWSKIILNTEPRNWHWCTQVAAHIIDNRSKYTGLKFQSFVYWGLPNYSKEISPYIKDVDESGFNRIDKAPLNKLLLYGGIDSMVTKYLLFTQKELIDKHLEKGLDLFVEGTLALADVQIAGVNVNTEYYKNSHKELEDRIEERKKELLSYDECKKFLEVVGREPNLGSSDDLRTMFYDILKLRPPKVTDKGNNSVDADTMSKLNTPLAKEITELSRIKKIDGTYMKQFLREIDDDGRIHPFFGITIPRTYRGQSDRPNLQNVPIRNEEAKRYARSGIIPSPGYLIIDFDYSGIEVKMGCCYTEDPVLIAYCKDPSTDMHRDTAADIFALPMNKVTKNLRFYTKNGFIFPEWYGSYYKNCALNIWKECRKLLTGDNIPLEEHLRNQGIIKRNPELDFINHVKEVESDYWKKFNVFKKWQTNWYRKYEKKGYVELLTGFRCSGYMGKNAIVNYAFQGTAFHCLLWSLTQIVAEFRERRMKSRVIGQIHDCCIIDCHPDELEFVIDLATEIATERILDNFKWINVPIPVEWETTNINESWYGKSELKED